MSRLLVSSALIVLLFASTASAHYLWLAIDGKAGQHGTLNFYFEEAPRAGDGGYLDPFVERGQAWLHAASAKEPRSLKLAEVKQDDKRWLKSELPADGARAATGYGQWGVYRYGKTDVLLHYYAKVIEANSAADLAAVAEAQELKLDLRPRWVDGAVQVQVLWDGKPAAGRPMLVRGPGKFSANLKTDDKGVVTFKPEAAGRYLLRTNVTLPETEGKFEGKAYQEIRHHGTLSLILPLKK